MPTDHEHDWKRVGTKEWDTGIAELDEQYETGLYECSADGCEAERVAKIEKTRGLDEWGVV